jgi:hypothetical protein
MQPMQLTGLRFLFNGGTFLNVLMPVEEAKTLVRRWASGDLALRGEKRITGGEGGWAVSLDSIAAIHLVADAPQQMPNAFPGAIPAVAPAQTNMSGFSPLSYPFGVK